MWDNVCSVHCIFSNYITVPEFPCNRKELKFCLTARSVLISGVNVLNITTSECTHPRPTLHFFPFHPFHPVAAGHRMAAPPPHPPAATDLRAAVPRVPQQHNCDSIPGPGTVVLLKVSFFLQSLLPEIHQQMALGAVCARPWMCCAKRRGGGRGLGTWEGSRQGWGRADCSSSELELGITSLVQPHQRHLEKPSLASRVVPLGGSLLLQRGASSSPVAAGWALPCFRGTRAGRKLGRHPTIDVFFSRQQRWVHSRTVAPQAASARQDGKKCN